MTASSLAALIDARTHLAQAELATLEERLAALQTDRAAATAELADFQMLVGRRSVLPDRLLRDALRIASVNGTPPAILGATERDVIEDELTLAKAYVARAARLAKDEADLAETVESVAAKRAELARLDTRARALVAGPDAGVAQLAVLRALADDATAVADVIEELLGGATADSAAATWRWPVAGAVTQRFGPSSLELEPAVRYRGLVFPHFHDGIDVGAPFGSAVVAGAPGRVTFVGHLPDGAMVVVIAHDDGLVSLSAHLDDAFSPPTVHAGDHVAGGQVIGYVGLTGMTTGPHLHFSVHNAGGPLDPSVVLSAP